MSNDKMRDALYEAIVQWDEGGGKRSRRELARRIEALSAQASAEPIGYIDRKDVARLSNYKATIWPSTNEIDAVPVYLEASPCAASPVVPEAIEPDDAPEMIPDDEEDMKNAYADGWNACRQALLATSAPSEPSGAPVAGNIYDPKSGGAA